MTKRIYGLRFSRKFSAREVVTALYLGLLGRPPGDGGEIDASRQLELDGELAEVIKSVVSSPEFRSRFFRDSAEEWVRYAFLGLLERDPQPDELAKYGGGLREGGDLAAVLAQLGDLRELWHLQLERNMDEVAASVARTLLPRSEVGSSAAEETHDSAAILAERIKKLTYSDEFFRVLAGRRSTAMVNAIYRALLDRPADPKGLTAYSSKVIDPTDIGRMIKALVQSNEYQRRLKNTMSSSVAEINPSAVTLDHIEKLFKRFAGRSATLAEISSCLKYGDQVGRGIPPVLRSAAPTRDPSTRKVLLFGAYGNGNMGDAYQAVALQKHLQDCWGVPAASLFATSILSSADFPFPAPNKLPPSSILNADLVNGFDCLVIGGGGLIAHPHDPLFNADWARKIHIPIVVLAVAATGPAVVNHRALLERAWAVSGRDASSLAALKSIREDAFLLHDPILCASSSEELCDLDEPSAAAPDGAGGEVLWILKYPASTQDGDFLRRTAELIQGQARHTVVALEPVPDKALEEYLPGRVQYLRTLAALSPLVKRSSLVVSMRYHGAIFAALAGKPSLGYAQTKIKALYEEAGVPGQFGLEFERLSEMVSAPVIAYPGAAAGGAPTHEGVRDSFRAKLRSVATLTLV
jgi:polysaccharide pyruvyl transferase WcaK-like protein